MPYMIQDWTCRRLWPDSTFNDFESAWAWIREQDPEPPEHSSEWQTGWYNDYWVVPVEYACETVNRSTHNLDQSRESDLDLQIKQQTVRFYSERDKQHRSTTQEQ